MIDSRLAYSALVALMVVERGVELVISRRHVARLRARGGIELGREDYRWMVLFHAGFLTGCVLEVWLLPRPWIAALGVPMLALVAAALALRYWVMLTLGERWSTRVVVVPGDRLVTGGPFRFARHPNYIAVVVEVSALPLVHTAWLTAVVASAVNVLVLRRRIHVEEQALRKYLR